MNVHTYYVDSSHRISGTSNDLRLSLSSKHSQSDEHELKVLQAIIPNSYYLINSSNNTFTCNDGSDKTITLTQGNYASLSTLATEIKTQLDASTIYTFTVSANTGTNKLEFSTTGAFTLSAFNESLGDVLGFEASTSYASTANALTSVNVCNLVGTQYIDIVSDISTNSSTSNGLRESQMLARVPVSLVNSFDLMVYSPPTGDKSGHQAKSLRSLSLRLVSQYGNTLDLNGKSWSIVLSVEVAK